MLANIIAGGYHRAGTLNHQPKVRVNGDTVRVYGDSGSCCARYSEGHLEVLQHLVVSRWYCHCSCEGTGLSVLFSVSSSARFRQR